MVATDPPISIDRFLWVQAFVEHLLSLGAPKGADRLAELGAEMFEVGKKLEPIDVAEQVWAGWPSQLGDLSQTD